MASLCLVESIVLIIGGAMARLSLGVSLGLLGRLLFRLALFLPSVSCHVVCWRMTSSALFGG